MRSERPTAVRRFALVQAVSIAWKVAALLALLGLLKMAGVW